jgi:hypothetical protein
VPQPRKLTRKLQRAMDTALKIGRRDGVDEAIQWCLDQHLEGYEETMAVLLTAMASGIQRIELEEGRPLLDEPHELAFSIVRMATAYPRTPGASGAARSELDRLARRGFRILLGEEPPAPHADAGHPPSPN